METFTCVNAIFPTEPYIAKSKVPLSKILLWIAFKPFSVIVSSVVNKLPLEASISEILAQGIKPP